jgi:hypothetical protein
MQYDDIPLAEVGVALEKMSPEQRLLVRVMVEHMANRKRVILAWFFGMFALFAVVLAAVLTQNDPRLVIAGCIAGGFLAVLVVLKLLKLI